MDEITVKSLVSIRAFLERLALSDALSPHQVTEAQMAAAVLGHEVARAGYDPAALERIKAGERVLAPALSDALRKDGAADVRRNWRDRWEGSVGAELVAALGAGHRGGEKPSAEAEVRAARQIRDFLVAYHEPLDPAIGDGPHSAYQGGRSNRQGDGQRSIYLTAPTLENYLHDRFPDQPEARVLDLKRLMGGFSKETYIVTLGAAAGDSRIVIRKDGAGLPTGSSVVDEYRAIEQVLAAGVPAPKLLWLEADTQRFNTAFMAVEFVEGEPAHLNIPKDEAKRLRWAESLARALALLHSSTEKPDFDVRDAIRADIAALQRRLEERERSPHPGIAFGLSWLTDHVDDLAGRPACRVHGDVGFHNILMRDDEVRVLLDWEFSHYSDPVEDLIYVKPFMDDLGAWTAFLDAYRAGARFTLDEKSARFFEVWKSLRNAIACVGSLNSLLLPDVKDVALALAGNVFIPKFEIGVLDSVISSEPPD